MANEVVEKAYRDVLEALQRLRNVIDQHEALQQAAPKQVEKPPQPKKEGQGEGTKSEPDHEAYKGKNPDGVPIGQMTPEEVNKIRAEHGQPNPVNTNKASASGSFTPPKDEKKSDDVKKVVGAPPKVGDNPDPKPAKKK